jgi:3alpha(or 20beta)-hydroxysteroid dehydrogenase
VGVERLSGQTAIVTRASRGQGTAEVRRFVSEGAHVVIADVRVDDGERLAEQLGERARFLYLDVSDSSAWRAVLDLPTGWPPIRALDNNAGVHWSRSIEEEDPAEVMKMWSINQLGPLIGIKTIAPAMRVAGGGSIVNVSSAAGLTGLQGHGARDCSDRIGGPTGPRSGPSPRRIRQILRPLRRDCERPLRGIPGGVNGQPGWVRSD